MKICKTAGELRNTLEHISGKVGFVPTMGALHKGHLTLVEKARMESDIVVVSVFVNPIQFNNPNDLAKYPRTIEADCTLLERAGCDIVFSPAKEEMYPDGEDVALAKGWAAGDKTKNFGLFDKVMEGAFRPGHFNGVAIVVHRLFELVKPTTAYFGRKDFQQTVIVKSMVQQLNLPVHIEVCPTVREFDGLAMSSRNTLLNYEERLIAPQLYHIMSDRVQTGGSVEFVQSRIIADLEDYFKVDYFEIVDEDTLQPLPSFWIIGADDITNECSNCCGNTGTVACAAVWLGNIRLIDNIYVSRRIGPNAVSCAGQCSAN
ncbi:MAG: pantoate--beta-alanine ligase [Bacteroidales bacterium]|jgi:pantoate--beta-alanine ligase|nr:pantoate--beta-alanine ligase [Bacteroidales bacterium]